MFVDNISQFVLDFIQNNKNPNLCDAWNSKRNQEQLVKIIKKNNIIIKDPQKPKRGKSGYLFFCAEYREKMKQEFPELSVKEIVSKLGILWKKLKKENSPEVKKFEQMSLDDRNRYKDEMTDYVPLIRKINKKEKKIITDDGIINGDDNNNITSVIENEKNKQKEEKNLKRSKKKEKDDGYSKFIRSKRNKTRKTHPELDSEGILKYLAQKWEKFPDIKKEKYRNKK